MATANRGFTTGEPIWTTTRVPRDECSSEETDEKVDHTPILTTTRAP